MARHKPTSSAAIRIIATFGIIFGPGMIFSAIPSRLASSGQEVLSYICPVSKIAPVLDSMDGHHTIFSPNIYIGPALLFYTRHSVIGTPYHRNIEGIEDTYRIMSDTEDRESQRLIQTRGIDLILICRKKNLERFLPTETVNASLYARFKRQAPPNWLRSIQLSEPYDEEFILYAVKPLR